MSAGAGDALEDRTAAPCGRPPAAPPRPARTRAAASRTAPARTPPSATAHAGCGRRTRRVSTACASSFARSRTFFGYRACSTSFFIAAILPPAPSTSSALSRSSGPGDTHAALDLVDQVLPVPDGLPELGGSQPRRLPPQLELPPDRSRRPPLTRLPDRGPNPPRPRRQRSSTSHLLDRAGQPWTNPWTVTVRIGAITVQRRYGTTTLSDVNQEIAEHKLTFHVQLSATRRGARLARLLATEQLRVLGAAVRDPGSGHRRARRERRARTAAYRAGTSGSSLAVRRGHAPYRGDRCPR